MFETALFITSIIAGGVAAISGFGIGSLITPVLHLMVSTKLAVALVSIPHFIATAIRFWILRKFLDKRVFLGFGIMSAVGGLTGAVLHNYFETSALTLIFGSILIFSGLMGATNLSQKLRFHGITAWVVGCVSGVLGGLVGNQGGIRAGALLGFNMSKESFVATATATGLIVDMSRMPLYFWNENYNILSNFKWILIPTLGVIIGTFLGTKLLKHVSEKKFRQIVSILIFLLGAFMIYSSFS